VEATKGANGVDYAKYGEFGGKPAGGGHGGYQGGRSRDPRILSGRPSVKHRCPLVHGYFGCAPPRAETQAKPQN